MKLDSYKVNRKHRDQKPKAACTQWKVSEWQEIKLFSTAKEKEWVCPRNHLWAIEKIGNIYTELGNTDKDIAYMAKYVTNKNNEWHGYPVTPSRDADRPPTTVLDAWREEKIITKPKQSKIIKGKW
ncbi:hypothetical protein [Pseudoalteromonas sp. NGC95]|uniref:hypothetical protein n=1 Tax=Pseudoalteromonas sp. NGC95 TaxID=2792051 RepID=UPI0018CD97A7|nr:hypothetical protein [Pseudoalteromonas sp. NGC95]MBH0017894.1 hypothetical protein [Pseudoalteromonas sp. NGC95]